MRNVALVILWSAATVASGSWCDEDGYEIVYKDEFDGDDLDHESWTIDVK
jgi:hypothetical protein